MARLSVLDQSPVRSGATPADAIRETLALARRCDELGYTRYWLPGHHPPPAPPGPPPEGLTGQGAPGPPGTRGGPGGAPAHHSTAPKGAQGFPRLGPPHPATAAPCP